MKSFLSKLGVLCGVFAVTFSLALPASAMTPRGGETYVLPEQETISDDLYVAGGTVILNGNVDGDVYVAGGTVIINGSVSQDVVATGGNLTISGAIGDDLRVAGGNVSILNNVKGDVVAAGGNILISNNATLGGDVVVGAGTLVLDGTIQKNALLNGGSIVVNGTINGLVEIHAEEVRFGSGARVLAPIPARIFSPKEAMVDDGAQLANGTDFTKTERVQSPSPMNRAEAKSFLKPLISFFTLLFVLKLIGLMITAGLLVTLFKSYSGKLVDRALAKPGRALFAGFATLFLTPIAMGILLITILGSWLAVLLGIGYAFFIAMAKVYTGIVFGGWLWRLGSKDKTRGVDWKAAVAGTFFIIFLGLIPILGWIIVALAFLITLGGLYAMTEERIKQMR